MQDIARRDLDRNHLQPASMATFSSQSQRLVVLMRSLQFGTIRDLVIQGGRPVLHSDLQVTKEIRFGSDRSRTAQSTDIALKAQVLELFRLFEEIGTGAIEVLEVRHGLPFRVVIAESPARLGGA